MNIFNHKEGCEFEKLGSAHLMARDPNGPDSQLSIDENGIEFDYNECTTDEKKDWFITFNFCPCCGVKKE